MQGTGHPVVHMPDRITRVRCLPRSHPARPPHRVAARDWPADAWAAPPLTLLVAGSVYCQRALAALGQGRTVLDDRRRMRGHRRPPGYRLRRTCGRDHPVLRAGPARAPARPRRWPARLDRSGGRPPARVERDRTGRRAPRAGRPEGAERPALGSGPPTIAAHLDISIDLRRYRTFN